MAGEAQLYLTDRPEEMYTLTFPSIYACGLFVGKLRMEIGGDPCVIRCEGTGLECKLEFIQEGMLFGDKNRIEGKIKRVSGGKKDLLYTIQGRWDTTMSITDEKTKISEQFYDAVSTPLQKKVVAPIAEQGPYESAKVWQGLSASVRARQYDLGNAEKVQVEESARARAKDREARKCEHATDLFRQTGQQKYFQYVNLWYVYCCIHVWCLRHGVCGNNAELDPVVLADLLFLLAINRISFPPVQPRRVRRGRGSRATRRVAKGD